jgi:hypothetical protein
MEGRTFTLLPDFEPRPVLTDNNLSALPADYQQHVVDRYLAAGVPLLDANSGFEPKTSITPEARSGLWKRLAALAGVIQDGDTKAQYLADWRARFDEAFPPAPPGLTDDDMLPDGRQATVSALGGEGRGAIKVGCGGLAAANAPNGRRKRRQKAGRWAWDVGRRVTAGLIDEDAPKTALDDVEASAWR